LKKFEFLEHTADVYVAAYGATFEGAFENAALAMFETMTDTKTIRPELKETVEIAGEDEYALLYSWLEALLLKFEVEGKLYSKFNVKIRKKPEGYTLKAEIFGEPFDPEKHPSKVAVKAVTYHRMEIAKKDGGFSVKFILDI
jgi:SHS2 domain-containing protein